MLTVSYIFSQIFAIINYATLIISYQIKDNKKILIYSTIWCSFSAVSFYLLKAYTGCTMASLAVLRNILFMLDNKYGWGKNIYTLLFIILSLIVRTIFTYDGLLSLLPVIATLLYTISVWVDDNDLKRFSDSDEKGLYSMLQLRKTGNADRKEDRPVTYISTMEVNSFLRKRGIFKKNKAYKLYLWTSEKNRKNK